jgi:hypothetical protein
VVDEGSAAPIDHLEHQIESVRAAVIGIGHIEVPVLLGVEVSEEGEHVFVPVRLELAKIAEIGSIHREDVVELLEVLGPDPPRPPGECDPVPPSDFCRARIWGFAFVPGPCARRVDPDPIGQACLFQTVRQNAFSERRTADVAKADEKNGGVVFRCHGLRISGAFEAGRFGIRRCAPKLIG